MRVICSRCAQEGRSAVIREDASAKADGRTAFAVCRRHELEILTMVRADFHRGGPMGRAETLAA